MKRISAPLSVGLGVVVLLAACGGGGSSSDTASTTSTTAPAPAIDIRDPYAGTWVSCGVSTKVQSGTEFVRQQVTTTLTKSSSNAMALTGTMATKFFASTDFGCKGTVLGTNSRNVTWTFGTATKTLTLSPNIVTATALNWNAPAPGGLSAGSTITIDGLTYPGNYFTTALNADLYAYSPETGKLYVADATATAFDPTVYPVLIKQ